MKIWLPSFKHDITSREQTQFDDFLGTKVDGIRYMEFNGSNAIVFLFTFYKRGPISLQFSIMLVVLYCLIDVYQSVAMLLCLLV